MARSFDIPETQVLLHFPADAFPWHGRILVEQLDGANWLGVSPDVDDGPQDVDLNTEQWQLVPRNSLLPAALVAAGIYWFDPLSAAELRQIRSECKTHARLRGGAGGAAPSQTYWYYSDTGVEKFGERVDDALVQGADFAELQGHGLVAVEGTIFHCELVSESELDKWKEEKKKSEIDDRLLHVEFEGEPLATLIGTLENADRKWPSFSGPRATLEFLQAIAAAQGNFVSYHSEWVRLSGVPAHSPAVYTHRHDLEVLRMALQVDGVAPQNLSCIEQTVRHLLQTERAVSKNPVAPDYSGLGVITDGVVSSKGAAVTSGFDAWVAEQQKARGKQLQNERLYVEQSRGSASASGASGGGGERAPRPERKKKPKPKA